MYTLEIEHTGRSAIATSSLLSFESPKKWSSDILSIRSQQKSGKRKPKSHPKINQELVQNQSIAGYGHILQFWGLPRVCADMYIFVTDKLSAYWGETTARGETWWPYLKLNTPDVTQLPRPVYRAILGPLLWKQPRPGERHDDPRNWTHQT